MKVPKFIARGLASGVLRMRPEVMEVIKKLNDYSIGEAEAAPWEEQAPEPSSGEKDAPARPAPPCRSERQLICISPLPGRWIRWACLTLAWMALCSVRLAMAGEGLSAFYTANQVMAEGNLAEASRSLEGIIAKRGYSAPVLFNLANAQLRAGKVGEAVLNYERARLLEPHDPDIAANLRLAQERAQALSSAAERLSFCGWFSVNCWAGLGAGSLLLVAATMPLALLLPRQRPLLRLARVLAVVALLSSIAAIGARWGELNRAVVTAKAVDARISPVTVGSPIFTLPEGTVVSIVKSHGPFMLVSARNGLRGWVSSDAVEPVIRPAS